MPSLKLRIPPLITLLVFACIMQAASVVAPEYFFVLPMKKTVAGTTAAIGVFLAFQGVVEFRRASTTVNPLHPGRVSYLVVSGVYKFTRNPMYLGFLLFLIGWAFFLANALAFLFVPLFVLYMNRFQIRPEEEALSRRFGEEFLAYQQKVRRWL